MDYEHWIQIATHQVHRYTKTHTDVVAAFLYGSTVRPGKPLPFPDVDIKTLRDSTYQYERRSGHHHLEMCRGAYLAWTHLPWENFCQSLENDPFAVANLVEARIIYDPSQQLGPLRDALLKTYATPESLYGRVQALHERATMCLGEAQHAFETRDQLRTISFLWQCMRYACAMLPTLRLEPPTSRRAMLQIREDAASIHAPELADWLYGCFGLDRITVLQSQALMQRLETLYEQVSDCVAQTPPSIQDIELWLINRRHCMEGSQALFEAGEHQAAVYPLFNALWSGLTPVYYVYREAWEFFEDAYEQFCEALQLKAWDALEQKLDYVQRYLASERFIQ